MVISYLFWDILKSLEEAIDMTELFLEIFSRPTSKFLRNLTESQSSILIEFDKHNEYKNFAKHTRVRQLKLIARLGVETGKEYQDMTKEDIVNWLRNKDIIPHSLQTYQLYCQKFFKWLEKDIEGWFEKIENAYNKVIDPSDLWTPEDIQQLIKVYPETQYRALVATLYDSEARVSELCSMNIKHVEFKADICNIFLPQSKTKPRRVELLFATQELILWYNIRKAQAKPNDPLWISKCNRRRNQRLSQGGVYEILKYGQKLMGTSKKLHPHLLRHSMASYLRKNGYPDALHKIRMGLKPNSQTLERYTHISDAEVGQGAREAFGKEPRMKVEQKSNPLLSRKCPRCGADNRQYDLVCKKCFYTIDYETVHEDISLLDIFKTNFGRREKERLLREFNYLNIQTSLLQRFFDCFNGSNSIGIRDVIQHFSNLTEDQILELIGILIGDDLIDVEGNRIFLLDRRRFEEEIEGHKALIMINSD